MIDSHCHLEQKDYSQDRDKVIEECKKKLKAMITCNAHPKDIELTLKITKSYPNFIFASLGIHPEYIKDLDDKEINKGIEEIENGIKEIENHSQDIVAIGETGLDYYWVKEQEWREKQKILFIKLIRLAKKLNLPLIIHSRDASDDTINILEKEGMKNKKVLMHLFVDKRNLSRVIDNGWMISIGPGIARSKDIRKIARDAPLSSILLETDSPWFQQEGQKYGTPLNVQVPLEKIAEIKKISIAEVEKQTDLNAISFFNLKIK